MTIGEEEVKHGSLFNIEFINHFDVEVDSREVSICK